MSLVIKKYVKMKKLGRGSFGEVILSQHAPGKIVAIKVISKKLIQKQPHLQEYIKGQKEVMMDIQSPNIVELYSFQQDEDFYYFICQYCDGGDLLNYQAKQPNKVFTLNYATQILSQVLKGFETLHERGYLHRDIKPANILLKKLSQNKYQFKLGDFGLTKKYSEISGTVVGTQSYLSPEILKNQTYSFEVDMWAFGVLFYLMLNMQLPFKFNPYDTLQTKRQKLIKQATNFSYTEYVKKSKKRIMENCTPQVQDLFKRIFNPDKAQRITFIQIRQHPLFKKYFPHTDNKPIKIYDHKHIKQHKMSKLIQKNITNKPISSIILQNPIPGINIPKPKTTLQNQRLLAELQKIKFLYQVNKQLPSEVDFIDPQQFSLFNYNVLKYYVSLLRKLLLSLSCQNLEAKYPNYRWKQFTNTMDFYSFKIAVQQNLKQAEYNFSLHSDECLQLIPHIENTNPLFYQNLNPQDSQFTDNFKRCYRKSTCFMYKQVRSKFSSDNKYAYLTALIVMCHSFNYLLQCSDSQLEQIFPQFVNQRPNKQKNIDFMEIKNWLSKSQKQKIKNTIKKILNIFFRFE